MGEKIDNKELFKAWLCKQHKQDGNVYSANTINTYCSALSKSPEKLEGIDNDCKRSIFVYDDVDEFAIVHEIIKKAPNFNEVNEAAGNQAFKSGMIKYQEFLQQNSQGGSTMPQDTTLVHQYAKLLENTRNLILTGAPGTGKTYLAKQIAEAMDCTPDEIGFVQFHPSYDYTDFVEGLRPVQDESGSGQIGFERKDGVFKEFCARALQNTRSNSVDNFEESWNKLVECLEEQNFISIKLLSGRGEFRIELNEYGTGLANRTYENDDYRKDGWIQGKSKFFSKEQLYNVYKGLPGVPAGGHDNYRKAIVKYMKEELGLKDYFEGEESMSSKKFVFIIDEINRGKVAKIFGELFYSIDPGYRVTAGDLEAMKAGKKGIVAIRSQYANLELTGNEFDRALGASDYGHFFVPENVYIIGTMNDIDRSVESMDFAFRRRFAWAEIQARDTVGMLEPGTDENGSPTGLASPGLAKEAKDRMEQLNEAISETQDFGSAYHIGASYFLKLNQYGGDFERLWDYHIKGILEEYVRGHPKKPDLMEKFKAAYFSKKETSSVAEET